MVNQDVMVFNILGEDTRMYPDAHTHTHARTPTHFQETRQAPNRGGAHLFFKKVPHIKKVGHALNTTKSFNKPRFLSIMSQYL